MRNKDYTPIECKLCKDTVPACGMGSHLYHKHNKLSSNEYAEKYGEFRKSKLTLNERKEKSQVTCKVCNQKFVSHRSLLTHIRKVHKIKWQDYFIKYFFDGEWPTCECGCGEKVELLRHGKNDKGEIRYAREYLAGHNTRTRQPGFRKATQQQKENMRKSAIERMKKKKGVFYQSGPSKSEKELHEFVSSLETDIIFNDKELLSGLEVDIYIPHKNVAIEYNGSRFHSDLFKTKDYHLNKTKELSEKGIRLIHVWDTDWYGKKDIVKSIIKNVLGKTDVKVYGRKTSVKEISKKEASTFLSDNHLQGNSVDNVRLGLFYKNELISVMTFSKLRKAVGLQAKEGSFEITRFCNKLNTSVIGGASKLFKFFIANYEPNYILSFASRDWSDGKLYENLGMTFSGFTRPGYFYSKSRYKYSRFQFQKHKLVEEGANPEMTEYEIMLDRGFVRVWDCGNYKYELFLR